MVLGQQCCGKFELRRRMACVWGGIMVEWIRLWYKMSWSFLVSRPRLKPSFHIHRNSNTANTLQGFITRFSGFSDCTVLWFYMVCTFSSPLSLLCRKFLLSIPFSYSSSVCVWTTLTPPLPLFYLFIFFSFIYVDLDCSAFGSTGFVTHPSQPVFLSHSRKQLCWPLLNINRWEFCLPIPVSGPQQAPRSFPAPAAVAASAPLPSGSPDPLG